MRPVEDLFTVALRVATVAVLLLSVAAVGRLYGQRHPDRRWVDVARSRLVWGVPWGTLVVIAVVLGCYLFVQDGITDFDDPVTIPYRAYSYFYPLGMVTAPFSHAGPGHLLGNLSATVVVAPIVEYAWGHYPGGDGETDPPADADRRDDRVTATLYRNPWLRALVVFPLAVIAVGLLSSLFALGPVIGFSGVVFAIAAVALVTYPIVTIVGLLGVQGVLLTVYRALRDPIAVYVAEPRPPSAPSWAGIAIQGHALGFFIGLVVGIALLRRRRRRPDPFRIWLAVLLFGFAQGLWQIYWFGDGNSFVLFRGPGVLVVAALTLVVTLAVADADESLVPRRIARLFEGDGRSAPDSSGVERPLELARRGTVQDAGARRLERIGELAVGGRATRSDRRSLSIPDRRRASTIVVLLVLALVAGVAVPVNAFVLEDATASSDAAVEIGDYTVQYAEGVENELTSPVRVGPLEDAVSIESSGVIVASERRQLWAEVVPAHRLAYSGEESIVVGGPGWRETVHVERTGWEPVGNETVYQVEIRAAGDEPQLAYESNGSRADVRIDGRTVTVDSAGGEFVLEVESTANGTERVATTTIPEAGEATTAGGLTFEREGDTVYAASNGTRVAIASAETNEEPSY